jgi:hypothetical protein
VIKAGEMNWLANARTRETQVLLMFVLLEDILAFIHN